MSRFVRMVSGFLFGILVWLLVLAFEITRYASRRDHGPAAAAVVLGTAVIGEQPSPLFRERIRHAVGLYRSGRVRRILFTGGVRPGKQFAEAAVGKAYAMELGVPEKAILYETRSQTTYENLVEARAILAEQGLKRVLIVSDPLHMRRAMDIAQHLGLDAAPSPTPTSAVRTPRLQLKFLARETIFLAEWLARDFFHQYLDGRKRNQSL